MASGALPVNWDSALTLCRDLQRGSVSAVEVMAETYRRIDSVNGKLNALVNLLEVEEAMALAEAVDRVPVAERGPLHGLPMANKDAVQVAGFPTTWGFVPWADNVASEDDAFAARMRAAGAIFIGRTNMPEFGLGSHTFNALFGTTLNPYALDKTAGGSSGGAAVVLASDMLALADGSDMGGSLRNPASFCNVVGFRPSVGRMPNSRGFGWFGRLATTGPMARTVADTTLLFSVQAGPDPYDPLTLPESGEVFLDALTPPADLKDWRVALSVDLNGLPVDPEVQGIVRSCADTFANLGARVAEAAPDLSGAMDVFQVQRAAGLATLSQSLDHTHPGWREHAKDTALWNMDQGLALSADDILRSELMRTQIYARVVDFFTEHDVLLLPAAQVPPFDATLDWVREINGTAMATYIDWMTVCCAVTVTGCPAISVPGGFTKDGLPVGLQIVGKPRGDLALLKAAHAFEQATRHYLSKPEISATS